MPIRLEMAMKRMFERVWNAIKRKVRPLFGDPEGAGYEQHPLPEADAAAGQVDYVALKSIMDELDTLERQKRKKALHYLRKAKKHKDQGSRDLAGREYQLGRLLQKQADEAATSLVMLDSLYEGIEQHAVTVKAFKAMKQSTAVMKKLEESMSFLEVDKLQKELEETMERAAEVRETLHREPVLGGDGITPHWKELEALNHMKLTDDDDDAEDEVEKSEPAAKPLIRPVGAGAGAGAATKKMDIIRLDSDSEDEPAPVAAQKGRPQLLS